jgi:hypothetical protein
MIAENDRWSGAVFRISSGEKSIEDICKITNTQPTRSFIKGERYSKNNPHSQIREVNLWILESGLSDQESLESHIGALLSFLQERAEAIKELQLDCEFDILCSFSSENGQGGFSLDHKVLQELTEYPVDLVVNLYPPEKEYY